MPREWVHQARNTHRQNKQDGWAGKTKAAPPLPPQNVGNYTTTCNIQLSNLRHTECSTYRGQVSPNRHSDDDWGLLAPQRPHRAPLHSSCACHWLNLLVSEMRNWKIYNFHLLKSAGNRHISSSDRFPLNQEGRIKHLHSANEGTPLKNTDARPANGSRMFSKFSTWG